MKAFFKFTFTIIFLSAIHATAELVVTKVAAGSTGGHSLFIQSDGSLWGMGLNQYGQLQSGPKSKLTKPEQIMTNGVMSAAVGSSYSLFIMADGSLWGMGDGPWIQHTNRTEPIIQPEQVVGSGVIAVAAGSEHCLFLKSDGSVWGMGQTDVGQLGDGSPFTVSRSGTNAPQLIIASGVTAIAAGNAHSLFLKSDGSLWATGLNRYGQLGDGGAQDTFPYATNLPEQIVAGGVIAIAAGNDFSLFIRSDGSLWGMGSNLGGKFGAGDVYIALSPLEIVTNGVVAIAAGGDHSLFLKSDGSLWGMGSNAYGELGVDPLVYSTNQPMQIVASGVTAIAAGTDYSLFVRSDGSLWGMGDDEAGPLGDGFGFAFVDYSAFPEQILPRPQPILTQTIAGADLEFTATCPFGGEFRLLTSTALALPLEQWMPVWTNTVLYRNANNFTATLTNAADTCSPRFYILQSP